MPDACKCATPPFWYLDYETAELGDDEHCAEVTLDTCKHCGQVWLKYLIEEAHFSRSGRWWRIALSDEQLSQVTAGNARELIEHQAWAFVGGSYFDSPGRKVDAPIHVA